MVICGIEDEPDESEDVVIEKIIEVAKKLKTKLVPMEISAAHRLPTKNDTNAHPILARLINLRKKDELIRKSKEMRLEGIYVNPHLTLNT